MVRGENARVRKGLEKKMRQRYEKKLRGAGWRKAKCPEHGTYTAGVLSLGDKEFLSRCPKCRSDDARLELERLRDNAFQTLLLLGRRTMTNVRKRRETDREFFVRLVDAASSQRIAIGNYWASSEMEAIDMAKLEYPGLFARLETHTWKPDAVPTGKQSSDRSKRSVMG